MQKVDIDSVFKKKNARLYKLLPKFVLNYLKRIVHQQELNDFIEEHGEDRGGEFTKNALNALEITYNVEFAEPLDTKNRYFLVANHPLGGADGIILIDYFSRFFDKVLFPVNDILMEVENMSDIFLPVNKHGSQSRVGAKLMEEALASDAQILFFPAGLVSRKKKGGKIEDLEWKKHFITKAVKHNRDIVPIFITGRNSNFFYNLANIRSFLGIKANLEMLYLSDELFKQKGKKFTIKVGKTLKSSIFDKSRTPEEWAKFVKDKVYNLE
ncbi:MAG: glycerol acyltransferase [Flavobacteriaceae bacterium]|nr:glycerol acyltransferase [Flavobacteriaceae bacterium]